MKPGFTIDEPIQIYGPVSKAGSPGQHPHDGSRPTKANAIERPGPHCHRRAAASFKFFR